MKRKAAAAEIAPRSSPSKGRDRSNNSRADSVASRGNVLPEYQRSSRNAHVRVSSTASSASLGERDDGSTGSKRRSPSPELDTPKILIHNPANDTFQEDHHLFLIEEAEDEDGDSSLPTLALTDFTIYNFVSFQPTAPEFEVDKECQGASGIVTPIYLDDNESPSDDGDDESAIFDGDEENSNYVKLSKILEFWCDPMLEDHHLWLRTGHAWYRLDVPHIGYRPFFSDIALAQCLCNVVGLAVRDRIVAQDDFIAASQSYIPYDIKQYAGALVGHSWRTADTIDAITSQCFINRLSDLCLQHSWLARSPLVCQLLDRPCPSGRKYGSSKIVAHRGVTQITNIEHEVLKHKHPTFFTPIVKRIAKGFFYQSLVLTGENPSRTPEAEDLGDVTQICAAMPFIQHAGNPTQIVWDSLLSILDKKKFYGSVYLDNICYSVGDNIAVHHEEREINSNTAPWIGKIQYLFEFKKKKLCHVQWYTHGSGTVLGETASPKELFLLNECDDIHLDTILYKVLISSKKTFREDWAEDPLRFYCMYLWDKDQVAFLDIGKKDAIIQMLLDNLPHYEHCLSCAIKTHQENLFRPDQWFRGPDGISAHGNMFHIHDFVYAYETPYGEEVVLQIQLYKLEGINKCITKAKTQKVKASDLRGHCYAEIKSKLEACWLDHDDCYVLDQQVNLCKKCSTIFKEQRYYKKQLAARPLRAMELFAGAGGLSTGFDFIEAVKVNWAIEFSPGCVRTYRENHPSVMVYNQETNTLLEHTICNQHPSPNPLRELGDPNTCTPAMPAPGDVDVIIGGPPCQSFSGANYYKKVDDIRHTLIPNMISYVEYYKPKYFLMENVLGLLHFRLRGKQDKKRIIGGIQAGMVKFIMRALMELNYQVQISVLNACSYGSPQSRRRVIFCAAQSGLPIPTLPVPTHAVLPSIALGLKVVYTLPGGVGIHHPQRCQLERNDFDAPYPAVTVSNALSDLPGFNWASPKKLMKKNPKHHGRDWHGGSIPSYVASLKSVRTGSRFVGFRDPVSYAHSIEHPFQSWCRRKGAEKVSLQFTRTYSDAVIERTIWVPLERGADQRMLDPNLRVVTTLAGERKQWDRPGVFARLDPHGLFSTTLTSIRPDCKGKKVIHPLQQRVMTVREAARAQGFPDDYEFFSVNKSELEIINDLYRQIGNAVPVQLGRALALAFENTLVDFEIKKRLVQESVETDPDSDSGSVELGDPASYNSDESIEL